MLRSRIVLTAGALCLAIFLVLGTLPAMALGAHSEEASVSDSGEKLDSGEPGESNWTEVSSYAELKEQFKNPANFGKKLFLRLTRDITVEQGETLSLSSRVNYPIQQLDVGNFTISVEGSLTLPYQLCVSGAGGEKGLFHVKKGGYLELFATILTPESGYAVRQEKGGLFRYYEATELGRKFPPSEQLALAGPLAWPDWAQYGWEYLPVVAVRDGDSLSEVLPKTDKASVFSDGRYYPKEEELSVEWDIEAYAEQFEAQKRFVLTGRYLDMPAFATPSCRVVFMRDNPVVFTNLRSAGDETSFSVEGYLMLEDPTRNCWIEWSQDAESWSRVQEPSTWHPDGNEIYFWLDYTNIELPCYLSAAVEGADGKTYYSDTLMVDKGGKFSDNGGNRGGGSDLDGDNVLPPIVDGDESDKSSSSTPSGSETEDSSGSSNGGHGGMNEDNAGAGVNKVSEPSSSEADVFAPDSQENSQAQSVPQATDCETDYKQTLGNEIAKPTEDTDAARSLEPMTSEQSGEGTILAQTHDEPKQAAMSAKAAVQVAVGGAVFAGAIGLGVFKPQLLRLMEKLLRLLQK